MSRARKTPAAAAPARRKTRARAADALTPFAHLMEPSADAGAAAPARGKAGRAEEEDRREDGEEERGRARRARRAEKDDGEDRDDEDRERVEDDDEEDGEGEENEERDRARGRRTAAEEEDTEDDDEEQDEKDERNPSARAARSRERARCARILGSKAAGGRAAAAANLACNTTMSAKAAISLLGTLPKQQAAAPGLGQRMADHASRSSASGTPPVPRKQAIAASWDGAMTSAGITPRR